LPQSQPFYIKEAEPPFSAKKMDKDKNRARQFFLPGAVICEKI